MHCFVAHIDLYYAGYIACNHYRIVGGHLLLVYRLPFSGVSFSICRMKLIYAYREKLLNLN